MKTTDPFCGHDLIGLDTPMKRSNGVLSREAGGVRQRDRVDRFHAADEPYGGAAQRTGIWLSVVTTVRGIVILALARLAHLKTTHRRQRSVVRNIANDGVSRSTVCAVRKGIVKPPICRVVQFRQAVFACGDIG